MEQTALERLKSHQVRPTKIRIELLKLFLQTDFALSHSDIIDKIGGRFDRVTVYRALDLLDQNGIIHKITDEFTKARYALCIGSDCLPHKHRCNHVHFKCSNCGNIFCVRPVSMPTINLPDSYRIQSFSISAKGLCPDCANP